MRISYTVYKYSWSATIMDILGSIALAVGLYGLITSLFDGRVMDAIPFVIVGAIGFGIKLLAHKINSKKVVKIYKQSIEDPALVSRIKVSSVAAFSLYKSNPIKEIFDFVMEHNRFAGIRIADMNNGIITEEQAIQMLREYDAVGTQTVSGNTDISYSNAMFSVSNNVLTENEQLEADYKKAVKNVKRSKTALYISLAVFGIFVLIFALTKGLPFVIIAVCGFYATLISLGVFLSMRKKHKELKERLGSRAELIDTYR